MDFEGLEDERRVKVAEHCCVGGSFWRERDYTTEMGGD